MPHNRSMILPPLVRHIAQRFRSMQRRKKEVLPEDPKVQDDLPEIRKTLPVISEKMEKHRRAAKLTEKGRKQYNAGQYSESKKLFKKAIDLDPQYTLPITYLGHALHKQGKVKEAHAAWQRAYKLDPASEGGKKALKKLEAVKDLAADLVVMLESRVNKPPAERK